MNVVYYYKDDEITSARAFYEYENEADAEEAFKHLNSDSFADSKKINGKFIVFDIKKSRYEDTTVSELRKEIELLKQINALILDYDTSD